MTITTPPQGIDPDIIGDELTKRVKSNGKRTVNERLDYIALLIEDARADIKNTMKEIKRDRADIDTLKKKSILLWIERHPKIAVALVVPVAVITILHTVEYAPMFKAAIAFVLSLI